MCGHETGTQPLWFHSPALSGHSVYPAMVLGRESREDLGKKGHSSSDSLLTSCSILDLVLCSNIGQGAHYLTKALTHLQAFLTP